MHDLAKAYIENRIAFHLHKVTVSAEDGTAVATGAATITSESNGSVKFRFCGERITKGRSKLADSIPFGWQFEGLVGERTARICGQLQSGFHAFCPPENTTSIVANLSEMQLTQHNHSEEKRPKIIGYLPAPKRSIYDKNFLVTDSHPFFGSSSTSYRWIAWKSESIECGIRSSDNEMMEVRALLNSEANIEELRRVSSALIDSISMRHGYRFDWTMLALSDGSYEIIKVQPFLRPFFNHDIWAKPPIPVRSFDDSTNEMFMEKAMKFFLSGNHIKLDQLLGMFWEAAPTVSIDIREMALASAIEGLSNEIMKRMASEDTRDLLAGELKQLKKEAKLIKEKIEKDVELMQLKYIENILNSIGSTNLMVAKQKIQRAAEIIGVILSTTELDNWAKLRNPAMHGSHVHSLVDQVRMSRFHITTGILVKMMLGMIEYTGVFNDYSKEGPSIESVISSAR